MKKILSVFALLASASAFAQPAQSAPPDIRMALVQCSKGPKGEAVEAAAVKECMSRLGFKSQAEVRSVVPNASNAGNTGSQTPNQPQR